MLIGTKYFLKFWSEQNIPRNIELNKILHRMLSGTKNLGMLKEQIIQGILSGTNIPTNDENVD